MLRFALFGNHLIKCNNNSVVVVVFQCIRRGISRINNAKTGLFALANKPVLALLIHDIHEPLRNIVEPLIEQPIGDLEASNLIMLSFQKAHRKLPRCILLLRVCATTQTR